MKGKIDTLSLTLVPIEQIRGKGYISCDHGKRYCTFTISRLPNGLLHVFLETDNELHYYRPGMRWGYICNNYNVDGEDSRDDKIIIENLEVYDQSGTSLSGFASNIYRNNTNHDSLSIFIITAELIGLRLDRNQSTDSLPVKIEVDDFDVEIGTLRQNLTDHSRAYHYATISSYIRIGNIKEDDIDKAIECIYKIIFLLKIAQTRSIFHVARYYYDKNKILIKTDFNPPTFLNQIVGWHLIPDNELASFLTKAYLNLDKNYRRWNLDVAVDHYVQALTLRSIYPMSLGIFTAIETLKSAFFQNHSKPSQNFWSPAPEHFTKREKKRYFSGQTSMFEEIISILCKYFPGFCNLTIEEKTALTNKLSTINRKDFNYREQLKFMLEMIEVSFIERDIDILIEMRNNIIHRGYMIDFNIDIEEYDERGKEMLADIGDAFGLLQRLILRILGYDGGYNLIFFGV